MRTTEQITFRFYQMECCGHLLCWVNPRHPSYCPACGKMVYPSCKSWATITDTTAIIKYTQDLTVGEKGTV